MPNPCRAISPLPLFLAMVDEPAHQDSETGVHLPSAKLRGLTLPEVLTQLEAHVSPPCLLQNEGASWPPPRVPKMQHHWTHVAATLTFKHFQGSASRREKYVEGYLLHAAFEMGEAIEHFESLSPDDLLEVIVHSHSRLAFARLLLRLIGNGTITDGDGERAFWLDTDSDEEDVELC